MSKDIHPNTIKGLTPKFVSTILKKLEKEMKKKDKNVKIEMLKKSKKGKSKKKSISDDEE